MYNEDILNKILNEFSIEKTATFCEIVSLMYEIKYNATRDINLLSEYDFERDWWSKAYIELTKEINL